LWVMHDPVLNRLTSALSEVPGLRALVLGGSRARGTAGPQSDYDVGLYYDPATALDTHALAQAVLALVDNKADTVTQLGEWGPWINGGGWLTIGGVEVDLLYRDMQAVFAVIAEGREGRFTMNYQPGHPHGFASTIWMGEIAICKPLWDPHGDVAALKAQTQPYPEPLRRSVIQRFGWEAGFAAENAEIALRRRDATHIAGCAYRVVSCVTQSIFAVNRTYLINEKGAAAEAAGMSLTVPDLGARIDEIWGQIGLQGGLIGAVKDLGSLAHDLGVLIKNAG
jgi:predicted nucleotidyltransferase